MEAGEWVNLNEDLRGNTAGDSGSRRKVALTSIDFVPTKSIGKKPHLKDRRSARKTFRRLQLASD